VPLELPRTLSPSKVSSFTDCALAFRLSVIDRLPEPPSVAATRGTLVHAALERLFVLPPAERTVAAGLTCLDAASEALRDHPEFAGLGLDAEQELVFLDEAEQLVRSYFTLEDPTTVRTIGLEIMLDALIPDTGATTATGAVRLRGIIDRLDLDDDGELVVIDYKTGRAPGAGFEQRRLEGVNVYSLLCERNFGRRPARVKLLYLGEPVEISTTPSAQSTRAVERKVGAIWSTVERACATNDFRPRPSRLCDYCAFQAYCPAYGGEPPPPPDLTAAPEVAASTLGDLVAAHP
jgi:putative RecB family exonuclease